MPTVSAKQGMFRLVDLIVVVGIFAVLAGLAVPALLKLREAHRRSHCSDNLKAIAMAAHDYHDLHGRLPPGWLGPRVYGKHPGAPDSTSLNAPLAGVLVALLPHLQQDELEKRLHIQRYVYAWTHSKLGPNIDPKTGLAYDPPANVPWWRLTNPQTGVSNLELAKTRIPRFICPSDDPYASREGTIMAVHLYPPDAPGDFLQPVIFSFADHPEVRELGRTNYLSVAGCGGGPGGYFGLLEGVFTNRSIRTLGQITAADGSSNTLMFGESCGGSRDGAAGSGRQYAFSWFAGALPTYYGLPRGPDVPWYAFSSKHKATVLFSFCDGSVRGVYRGSTARVESDDWALLQDLAGYRDGGQWEIRK